MEELKWSKGEKYEQSFKEDKSKYIQHEVVDNSIDYNNMKPLLFEDISETSCMRISNKREDANTKLIERSMVENVNQNPFLSNNNYLNDLHVQDTFLKPKNSNFNIES
jgi:hypothetical protein